MIEDLRQSILKRLEMLQEEQQQLRTKNGILHDALLNDEELIALEDKLKAAKRAYSLQKQTILNEPEYRKVIDDLKDVKLEIKDLKALLTSELLGYFKENDSLELADDAGEIYRISFKGKVNASDQPGMFTS